jgi:hypothetical protein
MTDRTISNKIKRLFLSEEIVKCEMHEIYKLIDDVMFLENNQKQKVTITKEQAELIREFSDNSMITKSQHFSAFMQYLSDFDELDDDDFYKYVQAFVNDYEVEKQKRYKVYLKSTDQYLSDLKHGKSFTSHIAGGHFLMDEIPDELKQFAIEVDE